MARSRRATSPRCSTPASSTGGAHAKALGRVEDIPYLQEPAAPHLRALRRDRSAVARRLSPPWRAAGPGARDRDSAPRRRSTRFWPRACAGAAAPASRPASNGARSPASRPTEIHRLQRRRRRQRHVRRPHVDGRRSLPADRRHGDRRRLGRRDAGLCLYPLRISARVPRPFSAAIERARAGGLARRRACSARAARSIIEARLGAGAYICGEETSLLGEPGGQARPGPRQAAAAGDRRACSASRPSSTMC